MALANTTFLDACAGRRPAHTPIWVMRQAGRYLPEYRAIRAKVSFEELCHRPDLCAEVTRQPIDRFGLDAAILFSDIVVPLRAAGVEVDIVADVGPVIARPVRAEADVAAMKGLELQRVDAVIEAVGLLVGALGDVPLIGFAGAPFTLASYLVEGGPSKLHERTKTMMFAEPSTWHSLMEVLTDLTIDFLRAQLDAGVDAIQLFDS